MDQCPERFQDSEKLFWLSKLPSQIATLGELPQDPIERKLWVLARAEYKSYWAIRNGKATGQMYRAKLLHTYIWNLPQPKAKWTLKELVKGMYWWCYFILSKQQHNTHNTIGMPLECFAEIVGLEVNPSDFLGRPVTEQDWSTPIILMYRRLHDYIMRFFDKPKTCVSFLNLIEIIAHLGLIKRVGETLKVGCHRGVYLSAAFQVAEETSFRGVVSPQLQQLAGTPSDFFLEPSLAGGTTDQTRQTLIRYYWDCLKKCCCYKDAKPSVDFSILARLISDTILGSARLWDGIVEIPNWIKTKIETFKHYYPLAADKTEYCPADVSVYVNASQARVNYKSAVGHIVKVRQVTVPTVRSGFDQFIKTRAPRKPTKKASKKQEKKKDKKRSVRKRKKISDEVEELARKKIAGWTSAEQQVQWMYTIFHVGLGNVNTKYRNFDVIKVLKDNKRLGTVCHLLGETESSFTRRWCRLLEKPYISHLLQRATMAREYNFQSGHHLSRGLREFISEVYLPVFHRGYLTLPTKMSDFKTRYSIISHKDVPNNDYKKLRDDQREMHPVELAAMEAVKVVNLCPDIEYDVDTAKAILLPYDGNVLKKVLMHMQGRSRGEGRNLLKQVRNEVGNEKRRFQFTASAEECLFPRKKGLHHYQEIWAMQQYIGTNKVFYPHEVLEGGHMAHIAEQYSSNKLSLHPEGIWRLPKRMVSGSKQRLTLGSFVSGLTGSKRGRKQVCY